MAGFHMTIMRKYNEGNEVALRLAQLRDQVRSLNEALRYWINKMGEFLKKLWCFIGGSQIKTK